MAKKAWEIIKPFVAFTPLGMFIRALRLSLDIVSKVVEKIRPYAKILSGIFSPSGSDVRVDSEPPQKGQQPNPSEAKLSEPNLDSALTKVPEGIGSEKSPTTPDGPMPMFPEFRATDVPEKGARLSPSELVSIRTDPLPKDVIRAPIQPAPSAPMPRAQLLLKNEGSQNDVSKSIAFRSIEAMPRLPTIEVDAVLPRMPALDIENAKGRIPRKSEDTPVDDKTKMPSAGYGKFQLPEPKVRATGGKPPLPTVKSDKAEAGNWPKLIVQPPRVGIQDGITSRANIEARDLIQGPVPVRVQDLIAKPATLPIKDLAKKGPELRTIPDKLSEMPKRAQTNVINQKIEINVQAGDSAPRAIAQRIKEEVRGVFKSSIDRTLFDPVGAV